MTGPTQHEVDTAGAVIERIHASLIKVEVTYCVEDNQQFTREVDLQKVGGIVWSRSTPIPGKPPRTPKLPGRNKTGGESCPPRIAAMAATEADRTCCYWDGSRWVCPDDWDQ